MQYAGNNASFPVDFPLVDDSLPPTAENWNPALEALGDRTAWLYARSIDYVDGQTVTVAGTTTFTDALDATFGSFIKITPGTDIHTNKGGITLNRALVENSSLQNVSFPNSQPGIAYRVGGIGSCFSGGIRGQIVTIGFDEYRTISALSANFQATINATTNAYPILAPVIGNRIRWIHHDPAWTVSLWQEDGATAIVTLPSGNPSFVELTFNGSLWVGSAWSANAVPAT